MCGECLAEVMGRYASRTQFCELRRPSVAGEEGRGFSDDHQLCSERRGESSSGGSDKHLSSTPPGEEGGSSAGGSDTFSPPQVVLVLDMAHLPALCHFWGAA